MEAAAVARGAAAVSGSIVVAISPLGVVDDQGVIVPDGETRAEKQNQDHMAFKLHASYSTRCVG